MFDQRVTVIVGHFGSGKTEIALNGALGLAAAGTPVTVVDLDVVKPYFRSRAARELLAARGVGLIAPGGAHVFADLPIILPEIRSALKDPARRLILDVGGDDSGARVLGSLAGAIPLAETRCLLVLNFSRPFTTDDAEAETMVREIEAASRLKVDGLIANTHLMDETTAALVTEGYRMTEATGRRLGVPVVAVTVQEGMAPELDPDTFPCPLVRLQRIVLPPFAERHRRAVGPIFAVS